MKAPALVTGGAGFIGSHLVDRLIGAGYPTTVLDNFSTGRAANLQSNTGGRLTIAHGSVLDVELVDRLVRENPLVFHLAAAVGVKYILEDPLASLLTNVRGTENVLASAARYGARVVLASTSEIYGRSTHVPFRESDERVLGPTWVHRWSYSSAKAIDEHLAFAYQDKGVPVSIVRYFNSYGPRIDERGYGSVVARFISQALRGEPLTVHGNGAQTRCFTYVSDTVDGTLKCGSLPQAVGRVFNVGADQEVSILELARLVISITGSGSDVKLVSYESAYPRGFEDTPRRVPDVSLAREVLGFSAVVPIAEGMRSTVEWCRANYGERSLNGR